MKKLIALLLALLMVMSLVACGAKAPAEEPADEPADAPAVDAPADEPAEEPADEPAEEPAEEREHVTLQFYNRCPEQPNEDYVWGVLNEYLEEKLNTTVEWHFLGGTFSDKVSVMINSGEYYDAVWTSNWQNDYATNVARGAYLDLTELLNDYPAMYESMPEGFWEATKISGKIYAVPCQQIAARTPHMNVITEYAEAFGMTLEDQFTRKNMVDFEDYLQFCKDNYGALGSAPEASEWALYCGYEFLAGQTGCVAIKNDDPTCTVVNFYATPEFKAMCEEMVYLYSKGLIDDAAFEDTDYLRSNMISGRISLKCGGTYKPGGDVEDSNSYGIQMRHSPHGTSLLTTGGIIATMWGVSANTEHPDRVMEVLELLCTDSYVMNMLSYGIEGENYTVTDGLVEMIPDSGYNPGASWALGNTFLTYPMVGMPVTVWEDTYELNATADVSKIIGFTIDISPVELEVTNVTNVYEQYKNVINGNLPLEETLAEFNAKLEDAGIQTLIAEAQSQIDAFLASK